MTEQEKRGLSKLQMIIAIVIAVIGFTASALGGYYGGKADTNEKFHQVELVNQRQDIYDKQQDLAYLRCQKSIDDLVTAITKTNDQVEDFIRLYCARHGIVIERR